MIEGSLVAWLAVFSMVALATGAGVSVSRLLPWGSAALATRAPLAFGCALGPFFAGISTVVALAAFGGGARALHVGFVLGVLAALLVLAAYMRRNTGVVRDVSRQPWDAMDWVLAVLLVEACGGLLLAACTTALTQNDALEYATIGRVLFESRDLASSPVLDPEANSLGAYYPWTHPPLYVGLIYLIYQLQGHADVPGLIRLLAPWFLFASAALTYSLARGVSRRAGLTAALLLITIPLLFTGTIAALMDGLPVLGFAAIVTIVVGLDCRWPLRGVLIGATLGLALWTHSQAVLLIPLGLATVVLTFGLSRPRKS